MINGQMTAYWVSESVASAMELPLKAAHISAPKTQVREAKRRVPRWEVVAQWVLARPLGD